MIAIATLENKFDFYCMKGIIELLLDKTSLQYTIERSTQPFLHPGISADIIAEGKVIGSFGQIHPIVAKNYDLPDNVFYAEIDDDYLASLPAKKIEAKEISKYPIVERDLAVVVDENVTAKEMLETIKSSCGKLFYKVNIFDIYRNKNLGENKKSIAFNVKLSDMNKTLTF